jgi:L-fucose dehydrogenase
MNLSLDDKVILIPGGGGLPGSIGYALTGMLASEGACPVIMDLHPRGAERAAALRAEGLQAHFLQLDLTDPQAVADRIAEAEATLGRIDGVVNNAGINDAVGLEGRVEDFVYSLQRNLVYMFTVVKHALPALKRQSGTILNIGSKVALTGQGGTSGYAAAKGGVLGLTREWAVDLLPWGIRVNAIIIAEAWTPGYQAWLEQLPDGPKRLDRIQERIPLGQRMTRPEEIADLAAFLLSARAAHITAQFVHVDGGYVHLDRAVGGVGE